MPKLARQYEDRYHSDFRASSNVVTNNYRTVRGEYSDVRREYYGNPIGQTQPVRRRKPKARRKKGLLQPLIALGILALVFFSALPFSFNNITKAMFVPTPYQEIQTDMYDIGFDEYLYSDGVCAIEWADNIKELLTMAYYEIVITKNPEISDDYREIQIDRRNVW